MQKVFIESRYGLVQVDLPPEKQEVLPSVKWGDASGFPTVAYWLYKVLEKRITGDLIRYKLGNSLIEEIGACLLGGHGIPAANGLAAYEHMRSKGIFNGAVFSESDIFSWLSEPISLNGKTFKYRFAKQKAIYLHSAIDKASSEGAPLESGRMLRNWLLDIKGIGPKTASWVARNWLDILVPKSQGNCIILIRIFTRGKPLTTCNDRVNDGSSATAVITKIRSSCPTLESNLQR